MTLNDILELIGGLDTVDQEALLRKQLGGLDRSARRAVREEADIEYRQPGAHDPTGRASRELALLIRIIDELK